MTPGGKIDPRDLHVEVSFAEEEARFLASAMDVVTVLCDLTPAQAAALQRIATKFVLAGEALRAKMIAEHGLEAAEDQATDILALYPNIEEVVLRA